MTPKVQVLGLLTGLCFALAAGGLFPSYRYFAVSTGMILAVAAILAGQRAVTARLWGLQADLNAVPNSTSVASISESYAMHVFLGRFPECSIPTTGWSMRFANLNAIVELLDRKKPLVVVELGSGISTCCVAMWMQREGRGTLVSFEHDVGWGQLVIDFLSKHGLSERAEVIVAPLVESGSGEGGWYDLGPHLNRIQNIDLLIVDGPPAGATQPLSRLPAVERLHDCLSPGAAIVLDDVNRPGESEVVRRWLQRFSDLKQTHVVPSLTGLAILERKD